jgi:hypothetical protein
MNEYHREPLEGQKTFRFMAGPESALDLVWLDDDGSILPTLRESLKWYRDELAARIAVASGTAMRLEDKRWRVDRAEQQPARLIGPME